MEREDGRHEEATCGRGESLTPETAAGTHQICREGDNHTRQTSPKGPWWHNGEGPHQQEQKAPTLGIKFDGDAQQFGFFLSHILTYMQKYRRNIPTEGARIRVIVLALEGATT